MENLFSLNRRHARFRPEVCWGLMVALLCASMPLANAAEPKPAKLKIRGYGWMGNHLLKRSLRLLQPTKEPPEFYDATFVEDAALLLFSRVQRDGHLRPQITATLTLATGEERRFVWREDHTPELPRPLRVKRVEFRIREGVFYFYKSVEFEGLTALSSAEAYQRFVESGALLRLKSPRQFTPGRLEVSVRSLADALHRDGWSDAEVTVASVQRDDTTGAVRVKIHVHQGERRFLRAVDVEVQEPGPAAPASPNHLEPRQPYSRWALQDLEQQLRVEQFRRGYPDAQVELVSRFEERVGYAWFTDLLARVRTGPRVHVSEVRFEGQKKTKDSVMRRQIKLDPGDKLDRIEAERGRQRLSRLGVFRTVTLRLEPPEADERALIYEVEEGRRLDFSLLLGYGSYERLRGGFELELHNVFGLAHQARLRAIQSFKSSSGNGLYTLPGLIEKETDLFLEGSALYRQEASFIREEYAGSLGARRHFESIRSDIGLRYSYQFLNANEPEVALPENIEQTKAGAFVLDFNHDRRDNPLLPRRGYRSFFNFEVASQALGGETDYQRLEVSGSFHHPLGGGRFLHLGVSHGVLADLGGEASVIPFNKRFFPGGENSVRGFQQGEAAPLDENGQVVGAETYLLGNLEFEQALTRAWSVVGFVDAVAFARDLEDYPFDEHLFSAGGGLRLKTVIGPARLEYGYNLNPRPDDPVGTLHFSLGYPF